MGKMNLAEIMDRAVDLLRKYIKTVVMYAVGYSIFSFVVIFLLLIGGIFFFVLSATALSNFILPALIFSVMGILISAFSMSYHVGIIRIAAQEYLGEPVYAHNAVSAAFKSIFKVLGIITAALVLFIPVLGAFGAAVYFLYRTYDEWWVSLYMFNGKALLIIVLGVLLAIAAIFAVLAYSTFYAFAFHAAVIEKKGVLGSIRRSWQLVRRRYWKIFGCNVLFALTVYAVNLSFYSFLAVVLSLIYLVMKLLNIQQDYTVFFTMALTYGRWPLNILSWLVISPIGSIMLSLLYFNRRFEREGFDMVLKLKEIQKNAERKKAGEAIFDHDSPQA